ncbi:MAG: ABC transporter permease [Firmicutes bacterium]|nr:ABC transporter permease [Bacillota bacterium]
MTQKTTVNQAAHVTLDSMTLSTIFDKLRSHNRKNYVLYVFCNFISLLLITAYGAMMFSPTVLTILPEGGDSRKQMMMIFALACVGCVVFTIYAASLFYRMKSKEIGTLLLLGASKKSLAKALLKEVALLSCISSLAGTILGIPFAWLLWNLFRQFIIDSPEMVLTFDLRCLILSAGFILIVIAAAFLLGLLYLRKTDLMEVVNTVHRNETLRGVRKWFGPVGIVLLLFGAIFGYSTPELYMNTFSAYPPAWVNVAYAPVFIGLYMVLLHVVVNGIGISSKKKYKGLISRSMMKFQGRQTVNNLLVVTVLIAGGLFGAFYTPMLGTGQSMATEARAFDYGIHYPLALTEELSQTTDQESVNAMALSHGLEGIEDWKEGDTIILAVSGTTQIEEENGKFHYEYIPILGGYRFLSDTQYTALSGNELDVKPGEYMALNQPGNQDSYMVPADADLLTNMTTRKTMDIQFAGYHGDSMLGDRGYLVIDGSDYQKISQGLSDDWKERITFFNVKGEDNYEFARNYFDAFVDGFAASHDSQRYELIDAYDPVVKITAEEQGEIYWGDTDKMDKITYEGRDSNAVRLYWTYMPLSRTLDSHEFLKTMAVFLMMFVFIALICLAVAMIICHTRCLTIAINNRYVFDDLKRLGASPAFLLKEVRRQASVVFTIPAVLGSTAIYFFYGMIMYANDGSLTLSELAGMAVCLMVVLAVAAVIYLVYRLTMKQMRSSLDI